MNREDVDDDELLNKLRHNLVKGITTLDPDANTFGIIEESKLIQEINVKQANARMEKWRYMLDNLTAFVKANPRKYKERIRKGIPDCFRGHLWKYFSNVAQSISKEPTEYDSLVKIEITKADQNIYKDITRTFPNVAIFKNQIGKGMQMLFNVLKALALRFPEIGYMQGLGFMVGLLLTYMGEQEAYWLMVNMLEQQHIKDLYVNKMPELHKNGYILLKLIKKYLPKLFIHLRKENVCITLIATEWFVTHYARTFPFELLVRIWDIMLGENYKIIFRVPLALFSMSEKELLQLPFEELVPRLKEIFKGYSTDAIIKKSSEFTFSRKYIEVIVLNRN